MFITHVVYSTNSDLCDTFYDFEGYHTNGMRDIVAVISRPAGTAREDIFAVIYTIIILYIPRIPPAFRYSLVWAMPDSCHPIHEERPGWHA